MEILICHSCGSIIRSSFKHCTGCGAPLTEFSLTALPALSQSSAALMVGFAPDPTFLERVATTHKLAQVNGHVLNGSTNGNGSSNGNGQATNLKTTNLGSSWAHQAAQAMAEQAASNLPTNQTLNHSPLNVAPGFPTTSQPATASTTEPPAMAPSPLSGAESYPTNPASPGASSINTTPPVVPPPVSIINAASPVVPPPVSIVNAASPVAPPPTPVVDTTPPVVPPPTPVVDTTPPVVPPPTPVVDTTPPVVPPPVSIINAASPVVPPPVSIVNAASPVAPPPTPVVDTTPPVVPPPTPVVDTTPPVVPPPTPVVDTTPPAAPTANSMDFFALAPATVPDTQSLPGPTIQANDAQTASTSPTNTPIPAESEKSGGASVSPALPTSTPTPTENRNSQTISPESLNFFSTAPTPNAFLADDNLTLFSNTSVSDVPQTTQDSIPQEPETASESAIGTNTQLPPTVKKSVQEEDEDDDKSKPKQSSLARSRSRNQHKTNPEEDEEDDDNEATDSTSHSPKNDDDNSKFTKLEHLARFFEGDIQLAGKSISKKLLAIGIVVTLFVVTQLLGAINNLFGGSEKPPTQATIEGVWDTQYQYGSQVFNGRMYIHQDGTKLIGLGHDQADFQIAGTADDTAVEFNKQYINPDGTPLSNQKPVLFRGKIDLSGKTPYLHGIYIAQIRKGHFIHATVINIQNNWAAQMASPVLPDNVLLQLEPEGSSDSSASLTSTKSTEPLHQTLFKVAIGLLIIGLAIVLASLKLFGPAGLINIWAKKEYVPSQFKTQHLKMLKELGKPPQPGGFPLGTREDWNILKYFQPRELNLSPAMRESNPHVLVLGAGAKGKSRLIASFIAHDIEAGDRATIVIDSDGGLIDLMVNWIASHPDGKKIAKRVTILDPTHPDGCPAYNPLECPTDSDLQSAASAVVFGFKAIYTEAPGAQSQWNQQTANILRNAALLLMANHKTLIDLPTLLSDNDFRDILLDKIEKRKNEKVEFTTLLETWGQYKRLARTDQWINWVEPILNRVTPMLSDPRIRPILTNPNSAFDLRDIITKKKVLLVKIPQGELDDNANLLGSLLVTGLKQAALVIANATKQKHPVALYLDEFDNFIEKETVDAITSETKKFQIGMVAAIKSLQHLPEDFRNQLIINMGIMCAFSLAKKDGDLLGPQMFRVDGRKVKHQTIQNIFNRVNSSPQFELISDEEKLNIDRVVGQEERTFFCYLVGTVAGVFHMKAPTFNDSPEANIKQELIDKMYALKTTKSP